ncbi:uncharacterized protein LOC127782027 [Oryza glaberrima]|uniref:Uncharacterized protein n=1 Tax=Oryza barthii TaxID=65489 RepID=A0A0D3GWL1_9ORYZ|nr:uncharacterized protein LOC127782027 [Oryza glaberrima]
MNTEDIRLVQKSLNKKLTHEKCLSDISMLEDGVKKMRKRKEEISRRVSIEVARISTYKEKINKIPDKKSFTLQMDYINFGSILYASVIVTAYILERKDELARQKKL